MSSVSRWVRWAPVALLLLLAPACGAPTGAEPALEPELVPEWTEGGKSDSGKSELFAPSRFYFVRIKGWDPAKMQPATLAEAVSVPGAQVSIHRADPSSSRRCPDSEVTEDDLVYRSPAFSLRTSGNFTNGTPKSSYKIKFTKKEARLYGMRSLNLKSMWNDVSQMRESLAWKLFDEANVHASRHVFAKFCIDDRYYGLYSLIEEVDAGFLDSHFDENDEGSLYKAYWADIGPADLSYRKGPDGQDGGSQYFLSAVMNQRTYQLKTNDEPGDDPALQTYDDLAAFVRVINGVDLPGGADELESEEYAKAVEQVFDVKSFLRWASANLLLGAWDNYWRTPANYYLYNSGKKGAPDGFMQSPYFHWIPWDYDNSLGSDFFAAKWQYADIVDWEEATRASHGGSTTTKLPLVRNLLRNPRFRAYYLDHLEHLLDTVFNEEWLVGERIGSEGSGGLWDRVRAAAYLESDSPAGASHTGRQFTNDQVYWNGFQHQELQQGDHQLLGILHYVRMRHDSAREQLAKWRTTVPKGSSGADFPQQPAPLPE